MRAFGVCDVNRRGAHGTGPEAGQEPSARERHVYRLFGTTLVRSIEGYIRTAPISIHPSSRPRFAGTERRSGSSSRCAGAKFDLVDILEDEPTGVSKPTRQGKCLSEIGLLAMKGCVEAGDLRNLRSNILDCDSGRKVVRLINGANGASLVRSSRTKLARTKAHTSVTSV